MWFGLFFIYFYFISLSFFNQICKFKFFYPSNVKDYLFISYIVFFNIFKETLLKSIKFKFTLFCNFRIRVLIMSPINLSAFRN